MILTTSIYFSFVKQYPGTGKTSCCFSTNSAARLGKIFLFFLSLFLFLSPGKRTC